MEMLVPEVESYLEGLMCEISCTKSVQTVYNNAKTYSSVLELISEQFYQISYLDEFY